MKRRVLTAILAFMMVIAFLPMLSYTQVYAAEDIASGIFDGVPWRITADNELLIGEEGEEYTFEYREYRDWAPWAGNEGIQSVKVLGTVHGNGDQSCMFVNLINLQSLDLTGLDTSNVTNMDNFFDHCESLEEIDLSSLDTRNVTSMEGMFNGCTAAKSIDLSGLDTSKVTSFMNMFDHCTNLTSLDLSSFNTTAADNLDGMFYWCESLVSLDLSSFDTSKAERFNYMFAGCENLQSLNITSFDTSNTNELIGMFAECKSLSTLDVSGFDTGNVTDMRELFLDCTALESLDLTHFNTSAVTDMSFLFSGCESLSELNLSGFDTSQATTMNAMFNECKSLRSLDLSNFDTGKVSNFSHMFFGCEKLSSLDLSTFDTTSAATMNQMFGDCYGLKRLDISGFKRTDAFEYDGAEDMFYEDTIEEIALGEGMQFDGYATGEFDRCLKRYQTLDGEDVEGPLINSIANYDTAYPGWYHCAETLCGLGEHKWSDEYIVDKDPTCTEPGYESQYCNECGERNTASTREIAPLGHEWSDTYDVDVEPTCNTPGSRSQHCYVCGVSKEGTSREIPKLAHAYGDWTVTKQATCTETGIKERTCSLCGHTEAEVIPTASHVWDDAEITTPATCVSKGIMTYTCTQCGNAVTEEIPFDPNNHIHPINTTGVKSTPKWEGETKCIVCGDCGVPLTEPTRIPRIKEIVLDEDAFTFTGKAIEPKVRVEDYDGNTIDATNYTVEYANNVNVGTVESESVPTITVTFKGDYYEGTLTKNFVIQPKPIGECTFPTIADLTYTGKAQTPVTILNGGTKLAVGTDFSITYSDNINVGEAEAVIEGKGNYTGTKTLQFNIKAKSISNCTFPTIADKMYTGKALTPAFTLKDGSTKMVKGTDYTVAFSNNKNVGKAKVVIKGKGNYNGTKTMYFKINPKGTSISSVTAASKGFTVKWKKQSTQTTGYQIYYSTSSTAPKTGTTPKATISKTGTVSKKVTGLKGGKKYYVYVRTYKTVNGVKYYSKWSAKKYVTTKK